MKQVFSFLLITLCSIFAYGRQGAIDTTTLNNWRIVQGGGISNNGAYVHYRVLNWHTGSNSLFIQSTASGKKTEVVNGSNPLFSDDSRWIIFQKPDDSLIVMSLDNSSIRFAEKAGKHISFKQKGKEMIACLLKDQQQLLLHSLAGGRDITIDSVTDYKISNDGNNVVFITGDDSIRTVNRITPGDGKREPVWRGKGNPGDFIISADGSQIAFTLNDGGRSLWHYQAGDNAAMKLADNSSPGVAEDLTFGDLINFSLDGKRLFIRLRNKPLPPVPAEAVPVDVWSYRDPKLQSMQQVELGGKKYLAVLDLSSKNIIRLQQPDDMISSTTDVASDSLLFVTHRSGDLNEVNWNPAARPDCYIVNTHSGKRSSLPLPILRGTLSPGGHFFAGTDSLFANIYVYDILTQTVRNLTGDLPIPEQDTLIDNPENSKHRILTIAGWVEGDERLLVYDRYDIWLTDPSGQTRPVCLTGGAGRKNKISFRIADALFSRDNKLIYKRDGFLILDAFDNETKGNGYYSIKIDHPGTPKQLTMSAAIYNNPYNGLGGGMKQFKARDKQCYLVPKCTSQESPNYYFTTDFRKFKPLSDVHPERSCRWMHARLLSWLTPSGRRLQGILYLPQDFDSTKKYPVILSYYEKRSEELNAFQNPGLTGGLLNIPWFVSRDYLVFIPDIYYIIGHPGESILESVTSAADCLSQYNWIDTARLGLQGHSWSGYETNYIITHSNRFAAAVSGAGLSDLVSSYGSVLQGGMSAQFFPELTQYRIGETLYEHPDLYISNSPVFKMKDVTTPVLLLHNKEDGIVPVTQGLEMFLGLRRLGKKSWFLQYENEGHLVLGWHSMYDYTTRMGQFFDYYLKGLPAPVWMTDGIPAKLKGHVTGLEINTTNKIP